MRGSGTLPLNSAPEKSKPGCCGGQCSGWIGGWVGARARYCGRCLLQHRCFAQLQSAGLQCRPQLASCPAACEHFGDPVCSRRLQALTTHFLLDVILLNPFPPTPHPTTPPPPGSAPASASSGPPAAAAAPARAPPAPPPRCPRPQPWPGRCAACRPLQRGPAGRTGPVSRWRAGWDKKIFLLPGSQKEGLCIEEAPPPCRNRRTLTQGVQGRHVPQAALHVMGACCSAHRASKRTLRP